MVFEEGRTLSFTDYICDDGVGNGPYELKLSLTRTGDKVHLDFTGSQPAGRRARSTTTSTRTWPGCSSAST